MIEGNLEDAFGLAERLRTTLAAEPVHAGSARLTITASFGIAGFDSRDNFWDAVKNADAQLYAAKRAGKNVVALKGETPGPARLPECRFPATAHTSRAFKLRPPG
ncbi:GGDEF domain-containing protein [Pelagibacterium lacus]|uniref:GGDEF domain-containing protein n=1 Tax=Pelagibacterium lacus TaxID=2282655 RepID=UPI0034E0660F